MTNRMYGSTEMTEELSLRNLEAHIDQILAAQEHKTPQYRRRSLISVLCAIGCVGALLLYHKEVISKDNFSDLNQRTSMTTIQPIDSMYAPLFFQDIDNSNLAYNFLEKYGLDGSAGELVSYTPNMEKENGWIYVPIYPSSTCDGQEYSIGGLKSGTCFPMFSDSSGKSDQSSGLSVMFGCEKGERGFFSF